MTRLTLIIVALLVSGCAIPRSGEYYAKTPSSALCMEYLMLTYDDIHQRGREQALRARGEDCSAWVESANKMIKSYNANTAAYNRYLINSGALNPSPQIIIQNAPRPNNNTSGENAT